MIARTTLSRLLLRLLLPLLLPTLVCAADPSRSGSAGQYQSVAIERLQQALSVDPGNLPLRYYLGVSLLIAGQTRDAVEALRTAYPAFSDSVEMNYNLALAFTRLEDLDSAPIYLSRAEELGALDQPELYPLDNLYFNLAIQQLAKDDTSGAIRSLHKVLSIDPGNQDVQRLLGDLHAKQGDFAQARYFWELYLRQDRDNAQVKEQLFALDFNAGLEHLELKRHDEARRAFEAALERLPDSSLPLYYLGYLDYQEQDHQAAIERLSKAFATIPDEFRDSLLAMVYNSASGLVKAGRADLARPAVALLKAGDQADLRAAYLAGTIQLALKQYLPARDTFLAILEQEPSHSDATLSLVKAEQGAAEELFDEGRRLYRAGRYREALAVLEQTLAIDKAHPQARAYLEQTRNDLEEQALALLEEAAQRLNDSPRQALELARQVLAITPDNRRAEELVDLALDALAARLQELLAGGEAMLRNGAFEQAEDFYRQAANLDPNSAAARNGLEQLQQLRREEADRLAAVGEGALDQGELASARAAFAKALGLLPRHERAELGLERTEALLTALKTEALQLARRAQQAGQLTEAREQLLKAYRLSGDPEIKTELDDLAAVAGNQVNVLLAEVDRALSEDEFRRARNLLDKAGRIAPGNPAIDQRLSPLETGIAMHLKRSLASAEKAVGQQDFSTAMAAYRDILEVRPDAREAQDGLRRTRSALKKELTRLTEQGTAAIETGDYPKARALLDRALQLDPYQAGALQAKARLSQLQDTGLQPGDENRLYLSGIELYTRGRYEDAVSTWKQVLILDPQHEKARLNIAKAERKLRQIREYRHE